MVIQQLTDDSPEITGKKAVIMFGADWHEACVPGGVMDVLFTALASSVVEEDTVFAKADAETCVQLSSKYNVTSVPAFVLLNASGTVVETVLGGEDAAKVTTAVQRLLAAASTNTSSSSPPDSSLPTSEPETSITERLDALIRTAPVMAFIKGTPTAPKCGFSRQIVEILQELSVPFDAFDILTDEDVRQGLKAYSDWPTFPQLYYKGELLGGLDIVKEMKEDGSLQETLTAS